MDGADAGGGKPTGFLGRIRGWLKTLAEADRRLCDLPPVCCGAHIDHRRFAGRPEKEGSGGKTG